MEFNTWLRAKGFDPDALGAEQKAFFQGIYRSEQAASNAAAATIATVSPPPPPVATPTVVVQATTNSVAGPSPQSSFDQAMKAIEDENARQEFIRTATIKAMEANVGNPVKTKQLREMCEAALADKRTDVRAFQLALVQADRFLGPLVMSPQQPKVNEQVIEAAICMTQKLSGAEGKYPDHVLQAAHTNFRRGIGLQELLALAAERNSGYRGTSRDTEALCKAAFRSHHNVDFGPMSAVSPSTISVPGILSNVANKFLAAGFLYGEQSWRRISRIKPASDFKQMTTYRLTGANKFEKVAPGGEIKHGTLSELTYTNQVETYGKMLGIDRRDIRNDDLGAFTGASDELGRGAIDSLNEVFWTEWLNDAAFFNTDKSKGNYDDGATDSVLSLAGLDNANTIFGLQTKPDGTPLGVLPKVLLVPIALWATAANLMGDAPTAAAQSTPTVTVKNVWSGMFETVASVYLQSAAISGNSATAWYLLADPANVAAIEVAFLDGVETPTVETSEFDFDRLGIAMRAYLDWGTRKQEYRAGVKLKGAA